MYLESDSQNYLDIIFKSAERGMADFNIPISNEGKYEILMYGIWLGLYTLNKYGIPMDHEESQSVVSSFLNRYSKSLDIMQDREVSSLFTLREDDWRVETKEFERSLNPLSKQYLPKFLYLCFVKSPLTRYSSSIELCRQIDKIDDTLLTDFLPAFNCYFEEIIKEFKVFESDSNSYKSQANEIINNSHEDNKSQDYKSVYFDFEKEIIERISIKDINEVPFERMLFVPSQKLSMIDSLIVETIKSFKILDLHNAENTLVYILERDLEDLQNDKKAIVNTIIPMLKTDIEVRKRCVTLLRSMEKDKYAESYEDLESIIRTGENLLNILLQHVENSIEHIDFSIKLKQNKGKSIKKTTNNKTNTGCLSVIVVLLLISAFLSSI